ncbi:nitroreductase family deazaflavin-dependent oxidoreductase [Mycobacterium sp. PDNC021]|uniref:nitroreductase family deazaflavin-dependent oxidoreductase n=1 Tax=Mycobacterium sp. PDNC021 TaxID=3391399 RepID=UPI003AAA2CA1
MTVRDMVRVFNKHVLNPLMLLAAGRKYWYTGVIEHTGRRSGKKYATPVVIEKVSGGFLIPLPYGTHVDWLRNVQAMGHTTVRVHGQSFNAAEPVVIDAPTAADLLSARRQREFGRFGIKSYLKMSQQYP